MESLAQLKLHHPHQPLHLSLNPHRPSFPKPIISPLRAPPPHKPLSIKATSSSQTPKPSLLKTAAVAAATAVATTAFFVNRFHRMSAIAAPPPASTAEERVEESSSSSTSSENADDQERLSEELVSRDPDDVEALRSLMEAKIKANKLDEAVRVLDRLIEVEPEEYEWSLLKANIHSYSGELELGRREFEAILEKDPLRVEAYHGLVMATSQSGENLKDVVKRVEEAMKMCEKQRKKSEVRDFKLLIAQIRVMESNYSDALKLYQELAKDEPRDFRPYLCQGIIYTLLRKNNEAEKQFDKFRRLVPKNHPYREYFDDNMFATKLFAQKVDREKSGV